MTDTPGRKWQYGLAKLFWLQLAFTPLILGGAIGRADLRNRELWLGAILVVVPAIYATLLSVVFIPPRTDLPTVLHKRTVWGMFFGALYAVLLATPVVGNVALALGNRRTELILDALGYVAAYACLLAILGGITAGTWTALSPWALRAFKKR